MFQMKFLICADQMSLIGLRFELFYINSRIDFLYHIGYITNFRVNKKLLKLDAYELMTIFLIRLAYTLQAGRSRFFKSQKESRATTWFDLDRVTLLSTFYLIWMVSGHMKIGKWFLPKLTKKMTLDPESFSMNHFKLLYLTISWLPFFIFIKNIFL